MSPIYYDLQCKIADLEDQLRREREASEEFAGYHNELVADLVEKMEKYSAQVADLEDQLRQAKEHEETALDAYSKCVDQLLQERETTEAMRLNGSDTDQTAIRALQAQVAQLQTTVGQLAAELESLRK